MTEKTTKKTVAKASAGKQVKAAPAKAVVEPAGVMKGSQAKAVEPQAAPAKAKASAASEGAKPAKPAAKTPAAAKPKAEAEKVASPLPTAQSEVSMDVVARKAYEIFVSEGYQHGRDQEHWFRAEAELRGVLL